MQRRIRNYLPGEETAPRRQARDALACLRCKSREPGAGNCSTSVPRCFCKAPAISVLRSTLAPRCTHRRPSDSVSTSIYRQILSQVPSGQRRSSCIPHRHAKKSFLTSSTVRVTPFPPLPPRRSPGHRPDTLPITSSPRVDSPNLIRARNSRATKNSAESCWFAAGGAT